MRHYANCPNCAAANRKDAVRCRDCDMPLRPAPTPAGPEFECWLCDAPVGDVLNVYCPRCRQPDGQPALAALLTARLGDRYAIQLAAF